MFRKPCRSDRLRMVPNEGVMGGTLRSGAIASIARGVWEGRACIHSLFLFRELSAEQKDKLLERAQSWPEPLAKQVARTARAAEHSAEERQKLLIPLVDRSCSAPRLIATLLRFRPSFPFKDPDSVLIPATIDVRFA